MLSYIASTFLIESACNREACWHGKHVQVNKNNVNGTGSSSNNPFEYLEAQSLGPLITVCSLLLHKLLSSDSSRLISPLMVGCTIFYYLYRNWVLFLSVL